jgi:hypothetical protein
MPALGGTSLSEKPQIVRLVRGAVAELRDWKAMRTTIERMLLERTGKPLAAWNARVRREGPNDEEQLRSWLTKHGVTGYPRNLLVMERFGYPDFMTTTAQELVDAQYKGRPALRAIYDRLLAAVDGFDGLTVQARKTYVCLVGPKRTFARIQASPRNVVNVALRLDSRVASARLQPSMIHESMRFEVRLGRAEEVDREVVDLLRRTYEFNLT